MTSSEGRVRRLKRLGLPNGPVNLLALDHGLSLGWTQSQDSPTDIAADCRTLGLQGVVCHHGMLDRLGCGPGFESLLQLHGSSPTDRNKAMIASPYTALRADCVGVAVEFQASAGSEALAGTSRLIQLSHDMGLMVLVMANYEGEDFGLAATAVVGATQLGADLIKLRLPDVVPAERDMIHLRRVLSDAPPALVAGGDAGVPIHRALDLAGRLGMRGSCIGRHYFDSAERRTAREAVFSRFPPDSRDVLQLGPST